MKKLLLLIFVFFAFGLGLFGGRVFAQESPEETAKKYNVTFPIKELGNCANFSQCREFCEDPVNSSTCMDFAKKKGFYKEENAGKSDLLAKAKAQLGCNSESSCRQVCSKEENFEKCSNFARQNNLSGGHTEDLAKAEILQKAKSILGCNSESSCREVCSKEENRDKCSEFARQTGLRGGERRSGPGGCTSEETCRAFCSDPANYRVCSGYASSQGGNFSGPGGCNSEETCKQYCEKNPESCRSFGDRENYNPEDMCRKTPNCSWANNSCQCGNYGGPGESGQKAQEYAEFCRNNPDKCAPGQQGSFESSQQREDYEKYCRENPQNCKYDGSQSPSGTYTQPTYGQGSDPQSECTKYGCNWNGSNCDCSNKASSADPATECTKQAGCSWTGSSCNCSSTQQTQTQPQQTQPQQTYDPATECSKQTGCSWNGSSCQCTGVQGASTNISLFQRILNFFKFW